jgi:FixJ family two-component response regulator
VPSDRLGVVWNIRQGLSLLAHCSCRQNSSIVSIIPVTWGEPLVRDTNFCILVMAPPSARSILSLLEKVSHLQLVVCFSVEELVLASRNERYAVVLLPADDLISHEWWALWGAVSSLDPRPSILVYALKSDFKIWAGVMAAGGFDVITAPFTEEKIGHALRSAEDDFQRKLASSGARGSEV